MNETQEKQLIQDKNKIGNKYSSTSGNTGYNFAKNGVNQCGVGNTYFHFPFITQISWRGQDFRL